MLRRIVPALGVIALASPAAQSQEVAKGLFLDGWVDNILTVKSTDPDVSGESATTASKLTSNAKVKIAWNVTDAVSGKVGVKFDNNSANGAYLQEAFFSANFGDGFNVTSGKMISFVGLQTAEPTGLYRVDYTPTLSLYTADFLATSLGYTKGAFSGAVYITNGNFDAADTGNNDKADARHPGYGIDVTYTLPDGLGNVNAEVAYDPKVDGDAITQFGVNATILPVEGTTVLAEVISRSTDPEAAGTESASDLAWMLLGNQVVSKETIPASVSASVGQFDAEGDDNTLSEVALAVLTNPFGTSKFGLNAEVAYSMQDVDANTTETATTFRLEGLVVIP